MQKQNSHLDGVLHEKLVELLNTLAGPEKPEGNLVRQEKNSGLRTLDLVRSLSSRTRRRARPKMR